MPDQAALRAVTAAPEPVRSERLAQLSGLDHGFFGRAGGVSEGIYATLNAGAGSSDRAEDVAENRARIAARLGVSPERLSTLYQIHSDIAHVISGPVPKPAPQGDALVTRCPALAAAVLTADCAPILLADPTARIVAAAHAGWKGAIGGIIESTLASMERLGASSQRVVAAIGPCIGQDSYEVGPEFEAMFLAKDGANARFFRAGPGDRRHFDLKLYCAARLRAAGVAVVDILPHDTCADAEGYFSNRRRTIRGEPDYGRNLSGIVIARP